MDPITLGLMGASIGSKLFSTFKGSKANNASQQLLNHAMRDNEARKNNNVHRNYMDTNAAKGIAEQLRKQYKKQNDIAENTASVTGASDEAKVATKGKINEGLNDAMNQVGQQATAYQQGEEDRYQNTKNNLMQQQIGLNQQKAANAANLAGAADNLLGVAAGMSGGGGSDKLAGLNQFGRSAENEAAVHKIANSAKAPTSGLNMNNFFKGVL